MERRVQTRALVTFYWISLGRKAWPLISNAGLSSVHVNMVDYRHQLSTAALYFNKIQCFCFEEQRLLPGEQIDMPVFFYIDPEIENDPKMDNVYNLVLSYTFFKSSEEK
ncbi:Cytochrome c oxidase assembly protein COX11, mitochondrial [Vitis vinifera]|uniref:Cytochrome c oxidase assembly protein COX11, mitochondrial n=1 Tax=Vitis vinifera TaxID=29760 RepID=A0A438IYC1_VITVI|nr:Cytochrome c oxidase assembly protein COX11, mitochondrial [Vitis vinifera]